MKIIYAFIILFVFTGCYTQKQTALQIQLLMSAKPLAHALNQNKNHPSRLAKLKLVEPILKYSQEQVGLTPKNSYQKYIELKSPYVSWVVQASSKRSLNLKTWWFPFVGTQPYLGFFNEQDAHAERAKLKSQNYDVSLGGVKAFSLLGYYPDPIYSSMLDGVSIPDFIETLIHETVHRTIYVQNNYAFNENLANFIARIATANYLKIHPEFGVSSENYINEFKKNSEAQKKFNTFLMQTKHDLEIFYDQLNNDPRYKDENLFLTERQKKFDSIAENYLKYMNGIQKGTNYEYAFRKGAINNAVILSYAIYEEDQKPLEDLYLKSNSNIKHMVEKLKTCLNDSLQKEEKVWPSLNLCFK